MKNKKNYPLVAYIVYRPFGYKFLKEFLKNYKMYKSGINHELLLCFKQFKNATTIQAWKRKINIKFTKLIENNQPNDFDIGSYFRIAEKYPERPILFLNTYTKPVCNNWLKYFMLNYEPKSIIGATGSYASLTSMFLNFFFKQHTKMQQLRWGIQSWLHIKTFPNPHIRTSSFMMQGKELLKLNFDRTKFIKKIETNYFEGGRNSLTVQLKKAGFKILLVNSDGKTFEIKDWKKSQTFCLGNQEKLIFEDNRTNEYKIADKKIKKKYRKFTWGIN